MQSEPRAHRSLPATDRQRLRAHQQTRCRRFSRLRRWPQPPWCPAASSRRRRLSCRARERGVPRQCQIPAARHASLDRSRSAATSILPRSRTPGMCVEPCLQLGSGRRGGRHAVDDEFDFLSDPAPHDRIVAIQAHRETFAIEDLFANPVVDQALQLLRCRRSLPHALELCLQALLLAARHDDLVRSLQHAAMHPAVQTEQHSAEDQKVQQRFTQQALMRIVCLTACTRSATCRRAPAASSALPSASGS